ncbi:unnamed protein product, partial [marine sediment metagenome]
MARKIPFSYNFLLTADTTGSEEFNLGNGKSLRNLTVYVEENYLGPVLVDLSVLVENFKHQIGQPTTIFNASIYNAERFQWHKTIPMSRVIENKLVLNWANYCGED